MSRAERVACPVAGATTAPEFGELFEITRSPLALEMMHACYRYTRPARLMTRSSYGSYRTSTTGQVYGRT